MPSFCFDHMITCSLTVLANDKAAFCHVTFSQINNPKLTVNLGTNPKLTVNLGKNPKLTVNLGKMQLKNELFTN